MKRNTEGILLLNKPKDITSFKLVSILRKITRVRKIGHTGTLDPLATGVMVMLIGKNYTRLCPTLTKQEKIYETTALLGLETDTQDITGTTLNTSKHIPTKEEVVTALTQFQGAIQQTPPLYSAKKINGQKLYQLARRGQTIERPPITLQVQTTLIDYTYPHIKLRIHCSSGTYVRTLCHDLGHALNCYACMQELVRTQNGPFTLTECLSVDALQKEDFSLQKHLITEQLL